MKERFRNLNKPTIWQRLLAVDSWIDSSLYDVGTGFGSYWESLSFQSRRLKPTGAWRWIVEVADEGITLALLGFVVLFALAQPAFQMSKSDWRNRGEYAFTMLDRNGREIGQRGIRQEENVEVDELPDHFIKAVLATEDRRFFEHFGIDLLGLARALAENVRANSVVQGGSTITQQLAKNLFLNNERKLERKINEAFLSLWLEANLTKKEILREYINRAYMGGGNFGITAAVDYYFGKSIKDISLAEAAMLAGLYKAPTKYAPHINLPAARARANEVLTNMVQADFMTEGQVIKARREPANVVPQKVVEGPNYFLDWAHNEALKLVPKLKGRNFVLKTTVDLDLQKGAEEAIESNLRQYGKDFGVSQSAMVVIDHTGAVRAMVGGRDYGQSQFNRATLSKRQPGSSFKPYVYAAAIEAFDFDERTRVLDSSICLKGANRRWCPRNYSGGFVGRTNLTTALVKSINTVPVKLYVGRDGLPGLGGKRLMKTVRDVGIKSDITVNPTMVLGSNGVTVLEMAAGYGTFMSGGLKLAPFGIVTITDLQGNILYDVKQEQETVRVFSERTTGVMNRILAQIPEWGTGKRAALTGIRSAGKTGTTQAYRDAWYVGFTGNYVTAVWYGNDNYRSTRRLTGGRLPAMTWKKFMTFAHKNIELRPIPFIKKPFTGGAAVARSKQSESELNALANKVRPKLLSKETQQKLLELEILMRNAKKLKVNDELAGINKPDLIAR